MAAIPLRHKRLPADAKPAPKKEAALQLIGPEQTAPETRLIEASDIVRSIPDAAEAARLYRPVTVGKQVQFGRLTKTSTHVVLPKNFIVVEIPEKSENDTHLFKNLLEDFLKRRTVFELVTELLVKADVAEQHRPAIGEAMAQLIKDAHRDPAALEARLSAMNAVPATGQSDAPASWVEKTGTGPAITPEVNLAIPLPGKAPETRGRKRKDPPPTPDEIREAYRLISWQSRHKDEPLDPEIIRKARRDIRWIERQREAEKASGADLG